MFIRLLQKTIHLIFLPKAWGRFLTGHAHQSWGLNFATTSSICGGAHVLSCSSDFKDINEEQANASEVSPIPVEGGTNENDRLTILSKLTKVSSNKLKLPFNQTKPYICNRFC